MKTTHILKLPQIDNVVVAKAHRNEKDMHQQYFVGELGMPKVQRGELRGEFTGGFRSAGTRVFGKGLGFQRKGFESGVPKEGFKRGVSTRRASLTFKSTGF